jgi:hypothetical protein
MGVETTEEDPGLATGAVPSLARAAGGWPRWAVPDPACRANRCATRPPRQRARSGQSATAPPRE